MNKSQPSHDDEVVETALERTDGGYERSGTLLDRLPTRLIRPKTYDDHPSRVSTEEIGEENEAAIAAEESVPPIVTWHELLARGR